MSETVVLAYSGGLDTSVAVPWLRETHGHEVVTLTVDVGGGVDAAAVQRRALAGGARSAIVVDARTAFVNDYIWPALQAGALYQGQYPLATALARPLIARLLVEAAHESRRRPASPMAAPARATTRSASTWPSRRSTHPCASSRRCGSGWA